MKKKKAKQIDKMQKNIYYIFWVKITYLGKPLLSRFFLL